MSFKVAIIGAGSVGFTKMLISDLLLAWLDPRIRFGAGQTR